MKTKKKTAPKTTHISNIVKPTGMTPVQWQTHLRKYAAEKETFGIVEVDPDHAPGEYQVMNPRTISQYRVIYYGAGHELNLCACMDFKTSRIGTCKHMEAVKSWIEEKTSRSSARFLRHHAVHGLHAGTMRQDSLWNRRPAKAENDFQAFDAERFFQPSHMFKVVGCYPRGLPDKSFLHLPARCPGFRRTNQR